MAFTGQSGLLKFGFILSAVLLLCGLICLGAFLKNLKFYSDSRTCILYMKGNSDDMEYTNTGTCRFAYTDSALMVVAAAILLGFDWVTWKKSENYKGRRASVSALAICAVMCLLSFCNAIVVGLGIKSTCGAAGYDECYFKDSPAQMRAIYSGIGCATLSGVLFAVYGFSEYAQYKRRHVNGDKW